MLDALIIVPEITKGMKSIGSKALLKIKESVSILEYQIFQLKKHHKKINIHIIAGFEIEKIKKTLSKSRVNIIYEEDYLDTSQSKCLKLFLREYDSKNLFIISNGVLFKNNPFDLAELGESKVFLLDKPKANFNIGCCDVGTNEVKYLFYDLPLAWSECLYLNDEAIKLFRKIAQNSIMNNMYLFEVVNTMIANNIHFAKYYITKKNIMKINTIQDLSRAKVFI